MKTYHIGFTGTQSGMTLEQKRYFKKFILAVITGTKKKWGEVELHFHHGDCRGADKDAHSIIASLQREFVIHIHPPLNPSKRAFCVGTIEHPAREYLDRNHDIVDVARIMFATPSEYEEQFQGSGTWATIRYSLKTKTPLYIIFPFGEVTKDEKSLPA